MDEVGRRHKMEGKMSVLKNTIIISSMFFLILIILSISNYFINKEQFKVEPVHVFIALVPFIILLIVSGKLREIRGPGGLTLVMRDEARKPITAEQKDERLEIEPQEVMTKGGVIDLTEKISKNPPTTLSFQIGSYYSREAIQDHIRELERYPIFQNVLFTDELGNFKGVMTANDFKDILYKEDIVDIIRTRDILKDIRAIKDSVHLGLTNQQVLSQMERLGKNKLAVVDQREKFLGLITQEEIVRKVLTRVLREA